MNFFSFFIFGKNEFQDGKVEAILEQNGTLDNSTPSGENKSTLGPTVAEL